MKKKLLKTLLVILIIGAIVAFGYFLLKILGLDDINKLREIVNNNIWGVLIYILILIAQVLFLPAGTLFFSGGAVVLFGDNPFKAWIICWIGLALGSYLMFFIARVFGVKALKWIVGEEKANHYAEILGKGKFILPMILLIPIFPDDIVCAAAGLSNMNWLYFCIVVTITRGIDNFCTVFVGAEMLKTSLGIVLLCIFVVVMLIAAYFLTKYQDKIEKWLVQKFGTKKMKDKVLVEEKSQSKTANKTEKKSN